MRNLKKHQTGLTLIEVLLAISVSLIVMTGAMSRIRKDGEDMLTKAVGQQIEMVGNAANNYTALYYPKVIALTNQAAPGSVDDPGPRYCTQNVTTIDSLPASICTISVNTLRSAGLLPRNFSGRNAYGSNYNIYIRVIGTAPNYVVDGVVVTSQPFTLNGSNRYDLLGKAMQIAGDDSGMTRTLARTIEGLNGNWRDADFPAVTQNGVTYPGVNQLGLMAFRFGYGSSAYAAFMRADGTTPMTGNLRMGGNDIVDVGTIVGGHGRFTGSGASQEALALGGSASNPSNPDRTAFVAGGGSLAIRNRNGVSIEDMTGNPNNFTVGDLRTNRINSNGNIIATGNVNAQDFVASRNISATGTLDIGGVATIGGALNARSTVTAQGAVTSNTSVTAPQVNGGSYNISNSGLRLNSGSAWYYDSASAAWRADTMIYSSNTIRGNNLTADTNLTVGRAINITSNAVAPGAACGVNATLQRSTTGNIVQCASGVWKELGVINTTVANASIISDGNSRSVTATCPTNTRIVTGGYALSAWAPQGSGRDSQSPVSSTPSGNGWMVSTGATNGAGTAFNIYAVCAY